MARGQKVPAATEAKFRSKYLELGNAAAAARAVKIPETTGQDLAKRADADPAFVEVRVALYEKHLPEAEALLMDALRSVHERVKTKDPSPKELAAIAKSYGLKSFSYQNPKPQYFRGMADAVGKLTARRRVDLEKSGEIQAGPAVVIHLTGDDEPAEKKPDENSGSAATPAA